MGVTFDAAGPSSAGAGNTGSASLSWTHTPAGAPTAVLVGVAVGHATNDSALTAAATYGGTAMTSLGKVHANNAAVGFIQVFALANPAAGAQTVAVSVTGGTPASLAGGSLSYTGTGTTLATAFGTPVTQPSSGNVTGATLTLTGTSASNRVAVFVADGTGGETVTAGTLRYKKDEATTSAAGATFGADATSAAGNVSLSWTMDSDWYGAIGVEVLAASATPGSGSLAVPVPVLSGAGTASSPGGGGTYTLFGQETPVYGGGSLTSDANPYTIGTQFSVSEACTLTGVWFYSPVGAGVLPQTIGLYAVSGQSLVHSETVSWPGAAGSGWVRAPFASPPSLDAGTAYEVVVLQNTNASWYNDPLGYWTSGGPGAAGITSGPLTAPGDAASVGGQCLFTGGTTLAYPATSFEGANFWIDPEVSTGASPVTGTGSKTAPAVTLTGAGTAGAAPLSGTGVLAGRAAGLAGTGTVTAPPISGTGSKTAAVPVLTGTGALPFAATFVSTDSDGVQSWSVVSAYNGPDAQTIRVLPPSSPSADYPHGFIYALPVVAGLDTSFGDGVGTLREIGAPDQYNLTVVAPSFPIDPWYADNPDDGTVRQESFMIALRSWAQAEFGSGGELHHLIGFSKSGIGGTGLVFRHPDLWAKAAMWDFPAEMTSYDGGDPNGTVGGNSANDYGTDANFQASYRLTPTFLAAHGGPFETAHRLWIGGWASFEADMDWWDSTLTTAGVQHTYGPNAAETHAWHDDWVSAALADLFPAGITGTGSAAAQAATMAGAGGQTFTGTGDLGAGSPVLAGAGNELSAGTGIAVAAVPVPGGTGGQAFRGPGVLAIPAASVPGTGSLTFHGPGSRTAAAGVLHGSGAVSAPGTGTVAAPAAVPAGTGHLVFSGSGSLAVPAAACSGTAGAASEGTGSAAAVVPVIAGAGALIFTGPGALTARNPVPAGTGSVQQQHHGTLTAAKPVIAGSGAQAFTGSGSVTVPVIRLTGIPPAAYGTARAGQMTVPRATAGQQMTVPRAVAGQWS